MNPRVWQLLGLGWYIVACLVGGIVGGIWLDSQLGKSPLFLLIGLALGLVLAFYGMMRMIADATGNKDIGDILDKPEE